MAIKVVLVEPGVPGNIGAAARVMKNFGFSDMVLINPRVDMKGDVFRFAMHAKDIIENAQIYDSLEEFVDTVSYVVGTTAKIGTDKASIYARIAVSSADPSIINLLEFHDDIALLFGREEWGLTNEEIEFCDMTIHIPTADEYKALNLAQAIAIILYSISIKRKEKIATIDYRAANKKEKDQLIEWFEKLVSLNEYPERKGELLIRRFRNIVGRAFVSGKEAHSLIGVFSRSYKRILKYNELNEK